MFTQIDLRFGMMLSYHLNMISSLVIYVVHSAIIPAKTIDHQPLRSVVATYHPCSFFGQTIIAVCGLNISISAHRLVSSLRYANLHSKSISNILLTQFACVRTVQNID